MNKLMLYLAKLELDTIILLALFFVLILALSIYSIVRKNAAHEAKAQKLQQELELEKQRLLAEQKLAKEQQSLQEAALVQELAAAEQAKRTAEQQQQIEQEQRAQAGKLADQHTAPVAEKTAVVKELSVCKLVPQDASLRRHYLTHLRGMIEALTFARPTDCVLRRHYEQLINSKLEAIVGDVKQIEKLLADYEAYKKSLAAPTAVAFVALARVEAKTAVSEKAVFIPEDSALKRHYLTHIRSMLEVLTAPRPTDCVLRRHYEQLIDSKLAACVADQACLDNLVLEYQSYRKTVADKAAPIQTAPIAAAPEQAVAKKADALFIPEDSMLRRHYLTLVKSMIEALTFPRPTDSTLRRHYDQLITSELEACLTDKARMERLIGRYEDYRKKLAVADAQTAVKEIKPTVSKAVIPEDSMLKRHYMTHIRSMIESLTFTRPTDSTLRRHYEQLINSQLENCLNNSAQLQQLLCQYKNYKNQSAA